MLGFSLLAALIEGPAYLAFLVAVPVWRFSLARLDPCGAVLEFSPGDGWSVLRSPAGSGPRLSPKLFCMARPAGALWLECRPAGRGVQVRLALLVFADALEDSQWRDLRHTLRVYAPLAGAPG